MIDSNNNKKIEILEFELALLTEDDLDNLI